MNVREALEVKRSTALVGKEYTRVTTLVIKPPGKLAAWELLPPSDAEMAAWEEEISALVASPATSEP